MIALRHCRVEWTDWGCLTRFDDGTEVPASPHPEMPHYHVIAHRCGYGDDVMAYCREHELAHSFVAERLHDQPSEVLWALAHGAPLTGRLAAYEELVAQAMQRWARAAERPIISGVPWDDLKRDFLGLLDARGV